MKLILRRVFYSKPVNQLIIKFIRPFRSFIPLKKQFPIHGTFKVKGKNVESFKMTTNPTNAVRSQASIGLPGNCVLLERSESLPWFVLITM